MISGGKLLGIVLLMMHLTQLLFYFAWESLTCVIRHKNEVRGIKIGKEEIESIIFRFYYHPYRKPKRNDRWTNRINKSSVQWLDTRPIYKHL